jgi:hemerythrin-like domain-containing protein
MLTETLTSRRRFLGMTGSLAAGLVLPLIPHAAFAGEKEEAEGKETEVSPIEDLMREHGVLRRVLLIYEDVLKRLDGTNELPPGVIADSAGIIRRFVEDYHEKLEEDEIFPRFEKAGKLVDIVKVLYSQHQAGRRLTDLIFESSKPAVLTSPQAKEKLSPPIRDFVRLYRPHASREDTVLFPAFRSIVSAKEFGILGDKFEDKEQELFGKEGFEKMVDAVAEIEKKLGIFELSQFTPKS